MKKMKARLSLFVVLVFVGSICLVSCGESDDGKGASKSGTQAVRKPAPKPAAKPAAKPADKPAAKPDVRGSI